MATFIEIKTFGVNSKDILINTQYVISVVENSEGVFITLENHRTPIQTSYTYEELRRVLLGL